MATFTKDQMDAIVSRVAETVGKEVTTGEALAFRVSDLRAQFSDLVKGGEVAWTISYSTASAPGLDQAKELGNLGEVAWTISYSTSNAGIAGKKDKLG